MHAVLFPFERLRYSCMHVWFALLLYAWHETRMIPFTTYLDVDVGDRGLAGAPNSENGTPVGAESG